MTQDRHQAQKDIAAKLDRLANNAGGPNGGGASSKQCWYLASLLLDARETDRQGYLTDTNYALTMKRASSWIRDLKMSPEERMAYLRGEAPRPQ